MPDLDVQGAGNSYPPSLSAYSVIAGSSVTLTYRLSNFGTDAAPSSRTGIYWSTNDIISTSDTYLGYVASASLSAIMGRYETYTIDTTGWVAGTYYIGAVADYNDMIAETNENNNPSTGLKLTVTAPTTGLPDLDVQGVGDSFPPTLSASSVTAGVKVTFTYRLSNFGTVDAPASHTGLYKSSDTSISTGDTLITTISSASLTANTGRYESYTIDTTGWAAGTYYIGAVADRDNQVSESDENNNPSSGVKIVVTDPSAGSDAGNSFKTATAMALGTTISQSIGSGSDTRDYFSFTASGTGRVTASLTGLSADVDLRALNGDGTWIDTSLAGEPRTSATADEFVSFNVVQGQTYAFRLDPYKGSSSNYTLKAVFISDGANQVASSFRLPFSSLRLTQEYGRSGELASLPTFKHLGEDFGGDRGSSILAAANGKVVAAVNSYGVPTSSTKPTAFGNYVVIEHTLPDQTKLYTLYGHMAYVNAKVGDMVSIGDQLGIMGATGEAHGPHLHFEVSLENKFTQSGLFGKSYDSPEQWKISSHYTVSPTKFLAGAQFGNALNNTLNGYSEDNFFFPGAGNDTISTGGGNDAIIFSAALGSNNVDTISDYSAANDTIMLNRANFSAAGTLGKLSGQAFFIGSAASDATDRIIYDPNTGALKYDSDGNGPNAAVQFATLGTSLALTSADFYLF